jgi:transketolase
VYTQSVPFEIGKAIEHSAGSDLQILATGSMVHPSLEAASALQRLGYSVGVSDFHTIKPLDVDAVLKGARSARALMTVEEHSILGGLGGATAEVLSEAGAGVRLVRHGIRDEYSLIGPPTHLYRHYRLDAEGIQAEAMSLLADA